MNALDTGARIWAGLAVAPSSALMFVVGVLLAGALAGEFIAATTRLPRVVGYTLAGCVAAAFGHGVGLPLSGAAQTVTDPALGLLLFEIGSRVHLRWLRRNPGLAATSLLEASLSAVAVAVVLRFFDVSWQTAIACAILAMPAPAAVSGRVSMELGAEGQVTQRASLLTALDFKPYQLHNQYERTPIGGKLVFPGRNPQAADVVDLIRGEEVTFAAGVPTIWLKLFEQRAYGRPNVGAGRRGR